MPKPTRTVDATSSTLGKTHGEAMADSAQRHAIDLRLGRCLFTLDDGCYGAFVQALDHLPEPGPRLRARS
ncbi:hypothetical protein [Rubellimicrobium roseum]|uniref:Uncharacterized protein n=1 Tax=Rubellimicrobium roseum TaxID=687525 RepID=A0A5C4N657_9RHOB|nr:hypothetical protein [Rubellimicrobium roseum]TNC65787.1 hypothetical protein FHG71_17215 [Rubellimicrobium roseum]